MRFTICVIGAGSLLAKELLEWMNKWNFPFDDLRLYDDEHHTKFVRCCKNHYYQIHDMKYKKIKDADLYFICDEKTQKDILENIKDDAYIISFYPNDHSSYALPQYRLQEVLNISNHVCIPQDDVITLLPVLALLDNKYGCEYCCMTSLKPVNEMGYSGVQELEHQLKQYKDNKQLEAHIFPEPSQSGHLPVLFHPLPQCGTLNLDGETNSEYLIQEQCDQLLPHTLSIFSTCVRVSSMRGLSLSVTLKLREDTNINDILDALSENTSVHLMDDSEHAMYPITCDILHDYRSSIGRVRLKNQMLQFWMVSDSLSMRAASALQIGFYLYNNRQS